MGLRQAGAVLAAAALLGCGDDGLRKVTCVDPQNDFDIEQVSVLEGAYLVPDGADAVIIDANTANVPADGVWRVASVEVLVTIPEADFARYPANVPLTLQVWDGDRPTGQGPWEVNQKLVPSALSWSAVSLADPETGRATSYKRAWWTFDFSKVVPESGMSSSRYLVAARWHSRELPLIGASRYNRPCSKNWTDYADGRGWVLNPASESTCNWPMFRVGSEVITVRESCDE